MEKRTLTSVEYRSLVGRILREHGRRLGMLKVDACELADSVLFGEETECTLMEKLKAMEAS